MKYISIGLIHLILVGRVAAFVVPQPAVVVSKSFSQRIPSQLSAKLWERLEIEEDPEPFWYLINCVATNEIDLLRQCRAVCEEMPDAIRFVVPTEKKTRSHGANKFVTETKVKYQGYVFAKIRLCPDVYEAIQSLDLCRSWMGTVNHIGHKKLPPAPVALNDLEVEKFGLEEWIDEEEEALNSGKTPQDPDDIIVDEGDEDEKPDYDAAALEVYLGLRVNDMIKVTKAGKFFDEDGIVRRLKEGQIFVRFYTYGTLFEEWLSPGDVRKLTDQEAALGLGGPSQPVTQEEINPKKDQDQSPGSLRNTLFKGGDRNRRQDRGWRGDSLQDQARNDKNWEWYKDQQNQEKVTAKDDEWSIRAQGGTKGGDYVEGDADSQWGRTKKQPTNIQRQRNNSGDWNSFVSPAKKPDSSPSKDQEEDDFFASLMTDLSKDLSGQDRSRNRDPPAKQASTEDDFFASLVSEVDGESQTISDAGTAASSGGSDDDFFASLEADLESALSDTSGDIGADETGVGTSNHHEPSTSGVGDDDFFASLEAELASPENSPPPDIPAPPSPQGKVGQSEDLTKLTIPALKVLLKEKGLKVSGKKAELIERLRQ